jgi:two-component system chemotaxis response regulator CheY
MKTLVVDDDVISRMALIDLLSGYGMFDLVEAADGEAAWAQLQQGLRPVICFCDVRMPGMSGIDLLERMKGSADLAAVPVVLVSGASDRDTVLQAVRLGAVGYILKPLKAADACAHLDKIFSVTVDKLAENPAATMRRLNIGAERLSAYLNAFRDQIERGTNDIVALLASGSGRDAKVRIDAVHAGCTTLGLWKVAATLDAARAGVLDAQRIESALAEIAASVLVQYDRVKAAGATASK